MNRLESLLLRYFHYLDAKGRTYNFILGLIWMIIIGVVEVFGPDEAKQSLLYLLPIAFVAWFSGIRPGLVISLSCTVLSSINNVAGSFLISSWNIISAVILFTAFAVLLHKTRTMWENEKQLSRTDPLTGAKNLRAFSELVEHEMLRSQREALPFSLAYLDLDNFKYFNDNHGHKAGDDLLISIVATVIKHLRKTDVVGRLGGDEFAIFLPATDQASARLVMQKVGHELDKLMKASLSSTTFSMGVLTCVGGVHDLEQLISSADKLMYEVKRAGKDDIRYALYPPAGSSASEQVESDPPPSRLTSLH